MGIKKKTMACMIILLLFFTDITLLQAKENSVREVEPNNLVGINGMLPDVFVVGTTAYCVEPHFGISIYDCNNPRRPGLIGSYSSFGDGRDPLFVIRIIEPKIIPKNINPNFI